MIPLEVENRIARYYFQRYLPEPIALELTYLLLPYYISETEPSDDEMVLLAIEFLEGALEG